MRCIACNKILDRDDRLLSDDYCLDCYSSGEDDYISNIKQYSNLKPLPFAKTFAPVVSDLDNILDDNGTDWRDNVE